jgi:hypothetical protein
MKTRQKYHIQRFITTFTRTHTGIRPCRTDRRPEDPRVERFLGLLVCWFFRLLVCLFFPVISFFGFFSFSQETDGNKWQQTDTHGDIKAIFGFFMAIKLSL